ncbi:MAG: SDR family NAD(P)-dependent oxidoreductase [Dehalococcoidia bacterium]
MELGLTGKAALITGGSEGIGKATALELAREGTSVAICARRPDVLAAAAEEIRAAGGAIEAIQADVTNPEECQRVVAATVQRFGRLDILVNNAGTSAAAPFESVGDDAWGYDLDLKLMAAVRCSRAALPHMRAAGAGRIVNITAVSGKHPGASSLPTSVSRAAGIALTKAMSKDLASENILVNAVCIGLVKSGQIERAARARFPEGDLAAAYQAMGANVPLRRVGEAEEVAALIAFLVSARASFITGVAINADGGMSAVV